jgi:hypothetical protein
VALPDFIVQGTRLRKAYTLMKSGNRVFRPQARLRANQPSQDRHPAYGSKVYGTFCPRTCLHREPSHVEGTLSLDHANHVASLNREIHLGRNAHSRDTTKPVPRLNTQPVAPSVLHTLCRDHRLVYHRWRLVQHTIELEESSIAIEYERLGQRNCEQAVNFPIGQFAHSQRDEDGKSDDTRPPDG